jgi:hypothetical protein
MDLPDTFLCPRCGGRSPRRAGHSRPPVCGACGHVPAGGSAHRVQEEQDTYSPLRHFYLPIALIIIGSLLWIAQATVQPLRQNLIVSLALVLIMVVTSLAIMLAGAYVCATLLSVNFGSLGSAVLKFSAAAIFAGAIALFIARLDRADVRGLIIAWHAMVVIYWVCFYLFFELDLQETLMSVAIISLMQAGGICILWRS